MPRVPRLGLLAGLLAMTVVGVAGAIAAQAATGTAASTTMASAVSQADADCGCEEGTATCPTPSPVPSGAPSPAPSASVPASPPPPPPPLPSISPMLRLASVTSEIAAPTLRYVIDVDMSGLKNGEELKTRPEDPKPPQVKLLCPKRLMLNILYTTNPFQGPLLSILFLDPGFFPEDCWVTIKVLDPETGRVLETYEQPSDMILTKQDAIGFKHRPARIRVEVSCDE